MIYDRALKICELTDGTPLSGELTPVSLHLYAQLEVFYKRYWEAIIAGTQIDTMVQIPGPTEIVAGQYCILEDNRVYKIEQAQHGLDGDNLPITVLSLHRSDLRYDTALGGDQA